MGLGTDGIHSFLSVITYSEMGPVLNVRVFSLVPHEDPRGKHFLLFQDEQNKHFLILSKIYSEQV